MSLTRTVNWIPISESLPDDSIAVLMAFDDDEVWPGFYEAGEWYFSDGMHVHVMEAQATVTHWADFPEAPR